MVMKKAKTKDGLKAIETKLKNPTETVLCPNFHKELAYTPIGNSIRIKCPTPNCLYGGLRGI